MKISRLTVVGVLLAVSLFVIPSAAQSILWKTYTDRAKQASEARNYSEAEKLFKSALTEAESLNEPELIAHSYANLGAVFSFQSKYAEAEKVFLLAIKMRENMNEGDSDEITYPLSNLGLIYAEQKKYQQAEAALRRALQIREKTENPDIAVALLNLGKVYADQRKLTEAEAVYQKALEYFLNTDDPNVDGIINVVNNLALIFEELKYHKKLEAAYKILIAVIGKNYGTNDRSLVPYLDKYALLLRSLKRNHEALQVEVRANKIRKLK